MKKIFQFLTCILVLLLTITTTGCAKKREEYKTIKIEADIIGELSTAIEIEDVKKNTDLVPEGTILIGLLKDGVLYVENNKTYPTELKAGTYEVITMPKTNDEVLSLPSIPSSEGGMFAFSGWYKTSEFSKGDRVSSVNQLNLATGVTELYIRYISFGDACLVALVCIIIVFGMLALLWGIVALFKYIAPKEKMGEKQEVTKPIVSAPQKAFTMADITDDDMMAAALVATIDYHNETHKNVKVVSIKEIK